jgi:hypothetical protein
MIMTKPCTVFVAGSIGIERLDKRVKERIDKIVGSDHEVVVGDAEGVDSSVQEYLGELGSTHVTVFCTGTRPRNNVADWPIKQVFSAAQPGTRAYFTAKDLEMAAVADFGLMVWDCKSTGTLSNVFELLKRKKKSVVFANKLKTFFTVREVSDLEELIACMSEASRQKAEKKLGLTKRLESMRNVSEQLF